MSHHPHRQAHSPAAVPPPEPEAPPREGRDERGRFTTNNRGGPGNPFARQTAALRKQLLAAVTPEVMAQICTALILRAQGGNLAAIKLLFSYVLGKPAEAVNPDTLDHEEMQLYGRDIGMDELMGKVLLSVPAELACECVRGARPDILDRVCEAAAQHDLGGRPCGDRVADANGELPAPSANRGNGENGEPEDVGEPAAGAGPREEAPSPIGAKGGRPAQPRRAQECRSARGTYPGRPAEPRSAGGGRPASGTCPAASRGNEKGQPHRIGEGGRQGPVRPKPGQDGSPGGESTERP